MAAQVRAYRVAVVLLAAGLIVSTTALVTGGERAAAVDDPVEVVYVATGRNFPDALAGATLAATVGAPLLTVEPDLPLPAATIAALEALAPNRIVILGGSGAVSDGVRGALADYARSGSVTRIEGTNRHETAALIAEALPDRVHDADLLDGLDSTDFARSDHGHDGVYLPIDGTANHATTSGHATTAGNAERLGGFTHESLRSFSIPVQSARVAGAAATHSYYVILPAGGIGSVSVSFTLPMDYTPGTPVEVDLVLNNLANTVCTLHLWADGVLGPINNGGFFNGGWQLPDGSFNPLQPLLQPTGQVLTLRSASPNLAPGVALNLNLERRPGESTDTCGFGIEIFGFLVRY